MSPACMSRVAYIGSIDVKSVSWGNAGWWVSLGSTLGVWGMSYSWAKGPRRWWSS